MSGLCLFSKIIKFSPYPIQAEWALDKPNTFFEVVENPNKRLDFVFFQFVPFSITPPMGCLYDMYIDFSPRQCFKFTSYFHIEIVAKCIEIYVF